MKIAVMTDSTAYIPTDIRVKHDIHMVPLNVVFDHETYEEEIDITTAEFYEKMRNYGELPKTSQPSIGLVTAKLEELAKDYDAVIAVHLSTGISGTLYTVNSAGEMVEGIDVHTFDSEASCMIQGFYALEAAELAKAGATPEEILERLEVIRARTRAYFMVDDLTNLQRGGRLNGAQALVGSLLQVKPILHFENRVIVPFEKIRTRKKAMNRIMGMLEKDAKRGKRLNVTFIHANNETAAMDLEEQFKGEYPEHETTISYFGPVIGTHLGEGALGVGWYEM